MNLFWNKEENRFRAFWRLVIQILIFLFFTAIFGAVIGMVIAAKNIGALTQSGLDPNLFAATLAQDPVYAFLSLPISFVSMVLSMLICAKWVDKRPFSDFGFRFSGIWWKDFAFGLVLGAVLMAMIFAVELGFGWVKIDGFNVNASSTMSFGMSMLFMTLRFIFVGIYEEMLSRGYHLHNLSEGFRGKLGNNRAIVLAWLLSSSVFGVLHIGNPNASFVSTVNLIAAGLFLGLGYILTKELAIPIGLHMTWNFFQGPVFGFPVSGSSSEAYFIKITQLGPDLITGGAFGPEAGIIGLAAILLGSLLIWQWVRITRGEAKLQDGLPIYQYAPIAPVAETVVLPSPDGTPQS